MGNKQSTWDETWWDEMFYDDAGPADGSGKKARMQKVKLGLNSRPGTTLAEFALSHANALAANVVLFPTPSPSAADFLARLTAYQAAGAAQLEAQQLAKQRTQEKEAARLALEDVLRDRAQYVDDIALGDVAIIHAAAFDASALPSPAPLPAAPTGLVALPGEGEGWVVLRWKAVPMIKSYNIAACPDPLVEGNFKQVAVVTRTSYTVRNLTPGQKCWFRVAAVGAAGQGVWSNLAVRVVA